MSTKKLNLYHVNLVIDRLEEDCQQIDPSKFKGVMLEYKLNYTHSLKQARTMQGNLFITELLLLVLKFIRDYMVENDGTLKNVRWFQFIFSKNLRQFITSVIELVFKHYAR